MNHRGVVEVEGGRWCSTKEAGAMGGCSKFTTRDLCLRSHVKQPIEGRYCKFRKGERRYHLM